MGELAVEYSLGWRSVAVDSAEMNGMTYDAHSECSSPFSVDDDGMVSGTAKAMPSDSTSSHIRRHLLQEFVDRINFWMRLLS